MPTSRLNPARSAAAAAKSSRPAQSTKAVKSGKASSDKRDRRRAAGRKSRPAAAHPALLAGGNPQIAKADGEAPVQAYIAAMPGWKRKVGRRLDTLIDRTVPGVQKAIKWNSPFYGVEGQGWFLSVHCFTKHVKVAFFRGSSLRPPPPGESKNKATRYLDIHEDDTIAEKQLATWIEQAASIPGWDGGSPRNGGISL